MAARTSSLRRVALPVAAIVLSAPASVARGGSEPGAELEGSLARFWAAETLDARAAVASEIVASGAAFDDVLAGLRRGRAYAKDAPRGRLLFEHEIDGVRHPYMVLVPEDYTPERRWPVRFDLHGGMGAPEWGELDGAWAGGWTEARDQIVVFPAGWWDSMWWERSQLANFEAILRHVRATWNVDEDRVVAYGSSDGGAALFCIAMRQPDRFAGYAGHVAPPDRLVRADFRPDGQMHVSNLAGQRFHLGYGEKDKKVPLVHLKRYLALFEEHGALLDGYVLPGQGHGLSLPAEKERELGRFLGLTVRDPLPDRLSWSTESTERYARRSWLAIDELAPVEDGDDVDESNLLPRWGTALQRRGPTVERRPWGRVELERDGNRIRATTLRVSRFTLLLAPDEFDISRPVTVEVDGRVAFEGRVEPSVATLLKWATVDDERRRLFAAELAFDVP